MHASAKTSASDAARDRATRAHAILSRALDVAPDSRESMVADECAGDDQLAALVRRLLVAVERSTGFLETPVLAPSFAPALVSGPDVPDTVGHYLVVGVLGVGGMATVYEAVQEHPKRRVALKVLHHTPGNSEALLRFKLEAETLARLHHPGIAQIYEAGTADIGSPAPTPFLAMELVPDAVTITQFADQRKLSLNERLALVASVCDAVLHGHQNGVIHRDLKPGNVLVRPDGQVKVIDFGIARHTAADMQALTTATDGRRLMGTLNAMSPEQCADPGSVDVRTDVYSLGVILYELVTARPPHDFSRSSIPQAIRAISEEVPPRVGTLRPEARGNVEAIVATALAKDRTRRYAGADALAADIRRHLAHRPIEARTPGALEQLTLLARRNPPLVVALLSAAALLVAGVLVSASFAFVASKARNAALAHQRELEVVVDFQESMLGGLDAWAMGDVLRSRLASAVRASAPSDADVEWERLTGNVNFTTVAVGTLDETILERYRRSINDRFADQPLLRARLLHRLASTMSALGLLASAEPVLRTAHELRHANLGDEHEETLESEAALGALLSSTGRRGEAIDRLRTAHERAGRALGAEAQTSLRIKSMLAGAYRRDGQLAEAERLWTETLEAQRRTLGPDHSDTLRTLNNVGLVHAVNGRIDEAERYWREFISHRTQTLGEDHPEVRSSLGNLGVLLLDRGRIDEARTLIEKALASDRRRLGNAHPSTLVSIAQLASLHHEAGELEAAHTLAEECVVGRRSSLGPEHPDTLRASMFLAQLKQLSGHTDAAETSLREILAVQRRRLGEDHRDTLESLAALRDVLATSDRLPEALSLSTELITLTERVTPERTFELGLALSSHGALQMTGESGTDVRQFLKRGHDLIVRAVGPDHPRAREAADRLTEWDETARTREATATSP